MRFQGFIGPSYTLQSVDVDCQRTVNLYPEIDESGTGDEGEVMSLVGTPGLRLLCTLPTGPVRGTYTDSTGQLWAVGGDVLYQISNLWAFTAFGTLSTTTGPISFSDNGLQLVLVDGPYGYYSTISSLGTSATGTVTATGNPSAADTLTLGGTVVTFVSSTPTGNQVLIGATSTTTMANLIAFLQGSSDINIAECSYSLSSSELVLTLTFLTAGVSGNSFTLSKSSASLSLSGATLSGGGLSGGFTQITDPNFLGANQVTFMDGYLIFNEPNSEQFYLSPLGAVIPFSGLDVASAEANPDSIVGLVAMQENLYLFGNQSLEIWYDSGSANFPFSRVQGAVSEIGCCSGFTIQKIQNTVYWLGQDDKGRGIVYRAQGLTPQRISTLAIETMIRGLGDLSTARAWSYQQGGHAFYCLNLPGASTTWVFDTTTNLWHERTFFSAGSYSRHLVDCHAFAYNTNVGGDYSTGNIYALDPTVFTDNSNTIVRERTTPHISKDIDRIFHSRFILDMEKGTGLTGTTQGTKPQAMLTWSNDAGHSWSNEHWASIGPIGARGARVQWRRLGHSRDRVYRVRISDPIKVTLIGAEIDVEEGTA